jgi:hypothetical protein
MCVTAPVCEHHDCLQQRELLPDSAQDGQEGGVSQDDAVLQATAASISGSFGCSSMDRSMVLVGDGVVQDGRGSMCSTSSL